MIGKKWRGIAGFLVLILLFALPLRAQTTSPELREDIEVMETILVKLLESGDLIWPGRDAVHGVYLKNFGLLFTANLEGGRLRQLAVAAELRRLNEQNLSRLKMLSAALAKSQEKKLRVLAEENVRRVEAELGKLEAEKKEEAKKPEIRVYSLGTKSEESEDIQQYLTKLDRKIFTFLGNYADRGNRISPGEKIAVVVFLGRSGDLPKARLYQVGKRAVLEFRRGRLTESAFQRKVSISDANGEHAEEIDILAGVIETRLRNAIMPGKMWPGTVYGLYLKGLGVLFELSALDRFWLSSALLKSGRFRTPFAGEEPDSTGARKQELLQQIRDRLVETLGIYGPTLRFLPRNQAIFALFSLGGGWPGGEETVYLLRLNKQDALAYSEGRLSLAQLKRRAVFVEF